MKTKTMLWVFVASVAVAGCAALQEFNPFVTRTTCNTAVCHVSIPVSDCNVSDPGTLVVQQLGQIEIIFTLQGGRHDFTSTGIKFAKGQGTVFTNGRHSGHGEFRWTDNYTPATKGTYKYTITAVKDGSPGNCSRDPDIANGL